MSPASASSSGSQPGDLRAAGVLIAACSWNLTATGANADELAAALGTGLGAIGLFGAALWLAHALSQAPAAALIERYGTRRVALAVLAVTVAVNAAAALAPAAWLAGVTRMGAGAACGIGSVCALVIGRRATPVAQGVVGSATSAGAAAPLALVPMTVPALGWRASAVLGAAFAALALAALLAFGRDAFSRPGARMTVHAAPALSERAALRELAVDPVLVRLAAALGALTMLSWTVGNWIVPLLARDPRISPVVGGLLGALIFAGGIATRPLGAWIDAHTRISGPALIAGCLLVGAAALGAVATGGPLWVIALAIVALGLTATMPWAVILHAAGSARPEGMAAAVGIVGMVATLCAVVSIPLFGLAFDSGRETLALATLAGVAVAATVPLLRVRR